jgi:TPR repeat protein
MSSVPIPHGVDPDALVREWTPGAEAGDTAAISALCAAYLLKQDWEAAEPWAQRLLDGRLSVVGMRFLAEIREQRGDQAGAQEWKRRADQEQSRMPPGFPMERLIGPSVERFGEDPDPQQVRAAAQAGDEMAMTTLGMILLGKERDPQQAVRWLTPGAEAGDTLAIVGLYVALTELGDDDGAARWWERAAESGQSILMDALGNFAAPTGDQQKARSGKAAARQATAEEDDTGPHA